MLNSRRGSPACNIRIGDKEVRCISMCQPGAMKGSPEAPHKAWNIILCCSDLYALASPEQRAQMLVFLVTKFM